MDKTFLKTGAIGVISLGLLMGCSQPSDEERLATATKALESENYQEAVVTLRSVLQSSPSNTQARSLLAESYFASGDMESAVTTFEKALQMGSRLSDFSDSYFTALYFSDKLDQVDTILQDYQNDLSAEQLAKAQAIAGLVAARNNQQSEAEALFEKALAINDPAIKMLSELIDTYFINRDTENTVVIERANQQFKDDFLITSLVGEIAYRLQNFKLAKDAYERALEEKPLYLRLNLNLAQTYIKLGEFENATPHVDAILKRVKNQPLANQQKALIAISQKDFVKANTLIERAMANGMSSPLTFYIAGLTNFRTDNYERAIQNLGRIVNEVPADHPAKQMYVAAKLQVGSSSEAFEVLSSNPQITAQNANLAVNTSFSLLESGKKQEARKIMDAVDESTLDSDRKRQQLGMLKALAGDESGTKLIEDASKAILSVNDNANSAQSKTLLLSMKASSGDTEGARRLLNEWTEQQPDNVQNYLLSAELEKYLGNPDKLPEIYAKVLELQPDNAVALNFKAAKAFNSGNYAQANKLFTQVIEQAPNNRNAILGRFKSAAALEKDLSELVENLSSNAQVSSFTRLYANYLASNYPAVIKIGQGAAFNNIDRTMANYLISDAYLQTNQPKPAIDKLQSMLRDNQGGDQVRLALAKAYAMNKQINKALNTLQTVQSASPQISNASSLTKARLYLGKNAASNAKAALAEVTEEGRASSEYLQLEGRTNLALGETEKAVDQLRRSYEASPIASTAQYYYQTLEANGQSDDGVQMLVEHVEKHNDPQVKMLLAGVMAKTQPQKAINYYQSLVDENPDNWVAMNNLAWLLGEQNQLDRAYNVIREALDKSPRNQTLLDTKADIEAKM
ncbi:XrtA/PEP-CTERM system TPR-repeat protein PrsT [Salinimonas chungwhensis]|uniref:XrtA/PEP-CTERM system TPR-repeat protein PrsT n=1 Tax=Salinimonas chungwhensis TaxID=265425 RepID=UPI0003709486|nr:XrtA/PEP-CTERM system TPR-repeat protein PrsT [Salinimonas chungwhensis]